MSFIISKKKTGYILMAHHTHIKNNLITGLYIFKQVDGFKYLGVTINYKNYMHNEVKLRINSMNGAYFLLNKLLNSRLLSWVTKKKYI